MRGGLLIAKPAGGLGSGALRVNFTTVRPELALDTLTASMLFDVCAEAPNAISPAASATSTAQDRERQPVDSVGKRLIVVAPVFDRSRPRVVTCSIVRSNPPYRPEPAPSSEFRCR